WETVRNEYSRLADLTVRTCKQLPHEYEDAYYELVSYPVLASSNLYNLYYYTALNHQYAAEGRRLTADMASRAKECFTIDSVLSATFNHITAAGKWSHMMDQTHIGYTYWQQPNVNKIPDVVRLPANGDPAIPARSPDQTWGVTVEGSSSAWPRDTMPAILPPFDRYGDPAHYL